MPKRRLAGIVPVALVALVAATGASARTADRLPRGADHVTLDPAGFTTTIDNPYWPMAPGSRWVYRETDAAGHRQRIVVTVTRRTRVVAAGITARVVHDVATAHGRVVEDTFDWYAQDRAGNVWYLGEDTTEYERGKVVSTAGSWEAGVDGAQAGVIVPARPRSGLRYREEYYAGKAEDRARVLSANEQAQAPFGHVSRAILIKDDTPLEPRVVEYKLYGRGVGEVLAYTVSGGGDREELLHFTRGRG